jgi:hypothetical protein
VGYFRGRDGNVSWKAKSRDPSRNLGRRVRSKVGHEVMEK